MECFLCLGRSCSAKMQSLTKAVSTPKKRNCAGGQLERRRKPPSPLFKPQFGEGEKGPLRRRDVRRSRAKPNKSSFHRSPPRTPPSPPPHSPRLWHPSLRGRSRCCKISSAILVKSPLPSAGGGGFGAVGRHPFVDDAGVTLNSALTPVSLAVGRTERM